MVLGSLEPHFWGYRPRISLLHLSQALQQQKSRHSILKEFVKEVSTLANVPTPAPIFHCLSICPSVCSSISTTQEPILRATQYLSDIVRLQHKLYDAFHHRLDRKDARRKTISQFIKERTGGKGGRERGREISKLEGTLYMLIQLAQEGSIGST